MLLMIDQRSIAEQALPFVRSGRLAVGIHRKNDQNFLVSAEPLQILPVH
jgi:hypothetical protein